MRQSKSGLNDELHHKSFSPLSLSIRVLQAAGGRAGETENNSHTVHCTFDCCDHCVVRRRSVLLFGIRHRSNEGKKAMHLN